jgi:hypothetical protein
MVLIMKKLLLAALMGAACMGALAQQSDTVTIPAPAQSISAIEAPTQRVYMSDMEFGSYKGGYDLSNGQVLTLTKKGSRMYAEVGDLGEHQVVAVARNTFVALDQKLRVRIDLDTGIGDGVGGELVMVVPGRSVAGLPAQDTLMRVAFR